MSESLNRLNDNPQTVEEPWERLPGTPPRPRGRSNAFDHVRRDRSRFRLGGANSTLPDALHNDQEPDFRLMREKPVHRLMADMASSGYTIDEIATFTNYSKKMVSDVLRQPWSRQRMIKEIKLTVQEEMKSFLEDEIMPTLKVVTAVRDSETAKNSDRLAACDQILNRFLGRPAQPITSQEQKPMKEVSDEELEQRVRASIAREESLVAAEGDPSEPSGMG